MTALPTRTRRLAVAVAATAALAGAVGASPASAAYDPADPAQAAAYASALRAGAAAYQFGVPLLTMQRTFATATSATVPNGRGAGPVNQFSHFAKLADAKDRTVVAPNADTLYSNLWLDLRRQPQVIHTVAGVKRFHVIPLLSPYEENFANIGSPAGAHPDGDYLITGPGFRGRTPKGLTRIRSPYDRVWIVGRTEIDGPSDLKATRKVMEGYVVTPLNRWNPRKPYAYRPPAPQRVVRKTTAAHVPGTAPGEDPATFFDALGDQLRRFPPTAADAPVVATMASVGIGPGLHPTRDGKLTDAQLQGLRDAVTQGPGKLQNELVKRYFDGFDAHNGWLVTVLGHYGTDYLLRAIVDKVGLGAPLPQVAMYPTTQFDRNRAPLTGARRYVVHFPKSAFPIPVRFFWSLTMYDADNFFVVNPLGRYLLNDRSKLTYNADGSLDVYVQPTAPSAAAQQRNWLPSPASAAFHLTMRLYGMSAAGIEGLGAGTGWTPPTILPCDDPTNATATGTPCAS